ncbi:hypothetical protein JTE90_023244 [Oedothorax gibbosus]|uniref:Uncharacterized protein n=1 Tax=Oedothorax gibbosus TaxID=931172 RepID=A0AAV6TQD5_9ARAC|nr:hypothetical protein JTE90_023244 [Oedothorax gibbosus]
MKKEVSPCELLYSLIFRRQEFKAVVHHHNVNLFGQLGDAKETISSGSIEIFVGGCFIELQGVFDQWSDKIFNDLHISFETCSVLIWNVKVGKKSL